MAFRGYLVVTHPHRILPELPLHLVLGIKLDLDSATFWSCPGQAASADCAEMSIAVLELDFIEVAYVARISRAPASLPEVSIRCSMAAFKSSLETSFIGSASLKEVAAAIEAACSWFTRQLVHES